MKKFLNLKNQFLEKQNRVLVTISSGQDSIVTFFVLLHSKRKKNFNLEILYCQHFWQTKNFFSVLLIYQLSFLFEIPYNVVFPQKSLFTENSSRSWRKTNFSRIAKLEKIESLVTGQTLSDSVEKNFNNLLRGTTSKGFSDSNLSILNSKKTNLCFFSTVILKPSFLEENNLLKKQNLKLISKNFDITFLRKEKDTKFFKNKKLQSKSTRFLFSKKKIGVISEKSSVLNKKKYPTHFKKKFKFFKLQNQHTQTTKNSICLFLTKPLRGKQLNSKYLNRLLNGNNQTASSSFCIYTKSLKSQILYRKPILEKTRFTVSKLVKFYDFPVLLDITNFSLTFSRNKIRYKLFPLIRYLFNKKFEFLVKNFSKSLELEQKLFENELIQLLLLLKNQKLIIRKKQTGANKKEKCTVSNMTKNCLVGIQHSIIQQIFFEYREIELTSSQLFELQNLALA